MAGKMLKELNKKIGDLESQLYKARKQAQKLERGFERKIEDNPLAAVGSAFGVGVMVGAVMAFMFGRRR